MRLGARDLSCVCVCFASRGLACFPASGRFKLTAGLALRMRQRGAWVFFILVLTKLTPVKSQSCPSVDRKQMCVGDATGCQSMRREDRVCAQGYLSSNRNMAEDGRFSPTPSLLCVAGAPLRTHPPARAKSGKARSALLGYACC